MTPVLPEALEAQLRGLIDIIPIGIIIAEAPSGRIVRGNAVIERILGYKVDGAERTLFPGFWNGRHPDGRDLLADEYPMRRAVAGVATTGMVVQMQCGSGDYRWVRIDGAPIAGPTGQVLYGIITVTEIEAERQAQALLEHTVATRTAALRRSQARTHALFDQSPIAMAVLGVPLTGAVTLEECNAAFCRMAAREAAALQGQPVAAVMAGETGRVLAADARACAAEGGFECDRTLAYGAGKRVVRNTYGALPEERGGGRRVLLTQLDLTESRRVEVALRQTMRLEAIGQLTGGVAHEFNNLLTAVIGNLERLGHKLSDERQQRWIQTAMAAAQRGAALTQQLLAYARKQYLAPKPTLLQHVVEGMAELVRGSLGGRITVVLDLASNTWPALADAAHLESALLNLVVNARDAMPQGGQLTIAAADVRLGDPSLPGNLAPGPYVRLSVTDTGTGMAPEVLARAGEPFFTTKGIGGGSGLGLAQASGFAEQLGGTIRLHSQPGQGTMVEMFLPRTAAIPDLPSRC